MDNDRFDERIRALGHGTSRRVLLGVLAGLAGTSLSDAVAKRRRQGGKRKGKSKGGKNNPPQGSKVTICHRTGSETHPFKPIKIAADAVPAHEAHGDLVSCPGMQVLDTESCTCICPVADIACENGLQLDPVTCACVSPPPVCVPEECSSQNDGCTNCSCRHFGPGDICVCGHIAVCSSGQACDPKTGCP